MSTSYQATWKPDRQSDAVVWVIKCPASS